MRCFHPQQMDSSAELLPRVLIVSRRAIRKNKFVDFVGEYHLDLIVRYGAVPVIVPRVSGIDAALESFEPVHGVLLCEGEDVDPSLYDAGDCHLSEHDLEHVRSLHASDAAVDREKDSIELRLAGLCLRRGVPLLGICRGSQVLNVACGGTLYQDVEKEKNAAAVKHIDYGNYDGHRHGVTIVEGTPLCDWFGGREEIMVNSYHHQGVKRLGERFAPMAFAADGLIEGFYDPRAYDPGHGEFLVGLQFHPERMRRPDSDEFDYPGCPSAYREFVRAVRAYQKRVNPSMNPQRSPKLDFQAMEKRMKIIVRSFCIAKNICVSKSDTPSLKESDIEAGAESLESSMALSLQQENRLKQMGATVRNASSYNEKIRKSEERGVAARNVMEKMSVEQLSELLSLYHMMAQICSEVLEMKIAATLDT